MPNAIKWETSLGAGTAMHSTSALNNLASGSGVLGDEYDNSTNLNRWIALDAKFKLQTGAVGPVEIYLVPCMDGTNYTDSAPASNLYIGSFITANTTNAQRLSCRFTNGEFLFLAPPCKFKLYIKNVTGQALTNVTSDNIVYLYPANEEIQ